MNSDYEGFRKVQRLAYESVVQVAQLMQAGWTEIQAADLIRQFLCDSGIKAFFHEPYAWFGDRTRFTGVRRKTYSDFNPTNRRLKTSDVVILDVAPILDGYIGDIGYTFSLEKNSELTKAKKHLLQLRKMIPPLFCQDPPLTGRQIWQKVEQEIIEKGYDNIHQIYPFHVLGHRIRRVPFSEWSLKTPLRFSLHSLYTILSQGFFSELLGPDHQGSLQGLWAIEPHVGGQGFGAKFEEILVVDKSGAYWLDEQVPHVFEMLKNQSKF